MKIFRLFTALVIAALTLAACDDTTDNIGGSITNDVDNISISNDVFNVTSQSLVTGPILSRNNTGMLGNVKDPETGNYVSGDYMTQFGVLSSFDVDTLQYIKDANNGEIRADSCAILVSYSSIYGDSLAPMKVTAYEMSKPMPEENYETNFDAFGTGYVSEDNYKASATYRLSNSDTAFKIYLNKEYTDKEGRTWNNYGSYIMNMWVEHPEYFKTNYKFLHNVCPGFYLKSTGGIGNVANIWNTEIIFYWTRQKTIKASDGVTDSTEVAIGWNRFDGTEEVLQLNKIYNSETALQELANQENCTYLKSPAGIFTELTLPVEAIMEGHEKDTINTACVTIPRINNDDNNNEYQFDVPSTILMVQKDSLKTFFEKNKLTDNTTSYYALYNKNSTGVKNAYTFYNISNLIATMYKQKKENAANLSADWNKVVLVPITLTTSTQSSSTVITKINHDMALTSTRLVKGTDDATNDYTIDSNGKKVANGPIQIKVIYSKFYEK